MICPECIDGKGLVTLFRTVRPCLTCAARRAETAKPTAATVTLSGITFNADGLAVHADHLNGGAWRVTCPP